MKRISLEASRKCKYSEHENLPLFSIFRESVRGHSSLYLNLLRKQDIPALFTEILIEQSLYFTVEVLPKKMFCKCEFRVCEEASLHNKFRATSIAIMEPSVVLCQLLELNELYLSFQCMHLGCIHHIFRISAVLAFRLNLNL